MNNAKEDLKHRIAEAINEGQGSDFDSALHKLQDLARALQETLHPDKIRVTIEPGHLVNKGQQYRFILSAEQPKIRDTLFRAYLPVDGFPVSLDLFEDKHPECRNLDELETEVIQFFRSPLVRQLLRGLRDIMQEQSTG